MNDRFVYYWLNFGPNGEPEAIYAMMTGHGESHVSAAALVAAGRPVPATPSFEAWQEDVFAGRRCSKCEVLTDGLADVANHMEAAHSRFLGVEDREVHFVASVARMGGPL